MSRNTLPSGEASKGLGWPRGLVRIGRALGWPGSVSRGTAVAEGALQEPGADSPVPPGSVQAAELPAQGLADAVEPGVATVEGARAEGIGQGGPGGHQAPSSGATASELDRGSLAPAATADPDLPPGPARTTSEPADALRVPRETPTSPPVDSAIGPGAPIAQTWATASSDTVPQVSVDISGPSVGVLVEDRPAPATSTEDVNHETHQVGNGWAGAPVEALDPSPTADPPLRPAGPRRAMFERDEFDPEPADPDVERVATDRPSLPRPMSTRVFVVANQKGGVGKTTTSVNLAAALALGGLDVLVLDLDPQGNASTALGVDHGPGTAGTYEVLIEGAAIADHLVASPEAPGLNVLPATIDLAGAEIQLVSTVARENRLRKALRAYLVDHPADYVFLDCPPSLGLITLNALVAATEILIPIQCEYYALEGVSQLVRTIDVVKGELNEDLEVSTVLLTMYDARTRLAAQVADEVRSYFTQQTLPTVIPRSVRISEAPSYGQTVLTYHPDSAGAVSYLEAAQEIARRGGRSSHESFGQGRE